MTKPSGEITKDYALVEWGRFNFIFWFRFDMWQLAFHTEPCCSFYLSIGPMVIVRALK